MLEKPRRQGPSIFIYIIFGILIAIFIINFRPGQSRSEGGGCSGTDTTALTVDGHSVNQTSYKLNFSAISGNTEARVHYAFENLIRREILASAAAAKGIRTNDDMILEEIKKGWFFLGGRREPYMKSQVFKEDGTWSYDRYQRWVGQFNVSLNSYQDEQQRELLAAMMADQIMSSVRVSRDEARAQYLWFRNNLTFDAVVFRSDPYKTAMKLSDADIKRFVEGHAAEIKAKYDAEPTLYKGRKPEVHLREIFIAKADAPKADDKKTDDKKPDDKKVDDHKLPIEAAKTALEEVAKNAKDDNAFAIAAAKWNSDEALRNTSGDIGWRNIDAPALGEKAISDEIKTLAKDAMTKVIATDKGVYLVRASAKREGDLKLADVQDEIAATLAKDVWSKEAAKRAALKAAGEATSGSGKNLDQLFTREDTNNPMEQMFEFMYDPTLSPAEKARRQDALQKMMQGQQGPDEGEQGSTITWESKDIPAGWFEDPDGSSAGSAVGSGSAAPKADAPKTEPKAEPKAEKDAPKTGSGTGSGSGSGSTKTSGDKDAPAPKTDAPVTKAGEVAPSSDTLPSFGEVAQPKVGAHHTRRQARVAEIGTSVDLANELFVGLGNGQISKRVFEIDGNYVLVQLQQRPELGKLDDEFNKVADKIIGVLAEIRGDAVLKDWLKVRCEGLKKTNKLKFNSDLLRETDENGVQKPNSYDPCFSFSPRTAQGL